MEVGSLSQLLESRSSEGGKQLPLVEQAVLVASWADTIPLRISMIMCYSAVKD